MTQDHGRGRRRASRRQLGGGHPARPRLLYLAIWLRARVLPWRRTGLALRHPESLTAELSPDEEDWLAWLDRQLWPRQDRHGRLGADYTLRHDHDQERP